MIEIDDKYQSVLLEALEELMYKLSLQLDEFKGEPLGDERKRLTKKQYEVEKLQHLISSHKIK
ncbi:MULTISPECIES: hypothetical protein [unclassified Ekhidna]|jgi:hypothetical protein|uniref:hypothetical protein n=1 Tax=unclassified Ekhidna TaxID=2632188 RepID=UPI0032DE74E2